MSALYYCRQTTTACKGLPYPSKTHPYRYGTSGWVLLGYGKPLQAVVVCRQ